MFIVCPETLFTIVKNNKDIKSLNILGNTFLYTAYADATTFFLKSLGSIKELLNAISLFSSFSGLKPNLSRCEEAGTGLLKGVKVAVCGIKCIDLTKDAIKIIKIFFSYDENIELEQNFEKTITGIDYLQNIGFIKICFFSQFLVQNLNTKGTPKFITKLFAMMFKIEFKENF